ncbi:RPC19 [Bugula neritina]|uniref:RPC19 n=1 Tax=Bugula neritina TaxID=10212 RepID=A0A7J7J265_BUGNE|nr:RPC19 [Bugula neritina]
MKDARVEFCGYSVPHPSEDKINFRIQTNGTCSAEDALRQGLSNLNDMTGVILNVFEEALEKHRKSN